MAVALPEAPVSVARPPLRIDLLKPAFWLLAAVLAVLVLLPLAWLAYYSVVDQDGRLTLANFAALVADATMRKPFLVAIAMALAVGALSCAIATPLAWLVARTDMPGRRLVRVLVTASFVTPPFLGAIAWEILAAPNSGLLNVAWRALAGGQQYDAPLLNIYSFGGLVFAIACYTFPYVFTLVANGLDRVPSDLEDASSILGGRAWTTLRRITLPLVLPAMLAGSLIAILQALTMFGSPAILALPAGFHVITTKIWSLFQYPPKPGLAAAASLPLLGITVLLLQGKAWILGRKGYTVLGGKSGEPRVTRLGFWMPLGLFFALAVLSLTVLLPYGALVKMALTKNGVPGLTLHNFRFVFFEFSATRLAMWNTFVLGFSTATLGTGLALLAAYFVARTPVRGSRLLGTLATAPVAIPGIVLGVGLFLTYSHPQLMLYGTLWILLVAFLTIEMPAGYQQLAAAFHGIHPELEEASRILGASRLKTLRLITAPLLRTSVIATWCFVFIGTIRELSATILLTTANTKLVSVIIYDLNESGDLGAISVLGLMLLVVSFAVVLIANRLPLLGGPRLPALR
ncbi:iron ABC transporter permease [Ramlibacter sp.]|uniref:ABC transporter permease n=1 Tax=Ramlibacter sp. TaxID=1917967 RepID=UPI002612EC45|nr:iron ABC transporter permease [Ramlibacter sp.]MDB5956516.1 putative type Fe3+ transport system, permease component with duplicated domain [Ramlibacter sp.]